MDEIANILTEVTLRDCFPDATELIFGDRAFTAELPKAPDLQVAAWDMADICAPHNPQWYRQMIRHRATGRCFLVSWTNRGDGTVRANGELFGPWSLEGHFCPLTSKTRSL